jgi:lysozyme family protein
MADVTKAIEFMLRQEDEKLAGTITTTPGDAGGCTRFGLCAKFHPALVDAGFFDVAKTPRDKALQMAEKAYREEYVPPLRLDALQSVAVACAVLSFAVNDGISGGLKVLREALVSFGFKLAANGAPEDDATFQAENNTPEEKLVPAIVQHQRARYEAIVAAKPSQKKFFAGWMNRTNRVLALVKG